MENLAKQTALTIRRFGVYTVATAAFFKLSRAIREGVGEAIEFDEQFVKIRQVTRQSANSLSQLTNEVGKLSSNLGVSSKELLSASQVLAQAGFSTRQVTIALDTLAKTDLSPTFDSIDQAAEGTIALLNQFGLSIDELESKFGAINAVSAKFAVESADLITAVRTAGGAFAAAGGETEELLGLFTSVRQTTRASAASIAVGLKTISTRLQRGRTQSFLKDLGIDLKFVGEEARQLGKEGLFVGVYEAIRRISTALKNIPKNDPRFAQIAEELGGFRQIDKVIPLLTEFELAERARGVAIRDTDSLTKDSIIAQESLANQFAKVREQFNLLIRDIGGSDFIRDSVSQFLSLASAAIRLAETLERVAVPLTIIAGFKLAKTSGTLGKLVLGNLRSGANIPLERNTGGPVPGIGNKDTVNAVLTPGEYVINKQASKKLGKKRLDILNQGDLPAFNAGGVFGSISSGAGNPSLLAAGAIAAFPLAEQFSKLTEETRDLVTVIGSSAIQFFAFSSLLKPSAEEVGNFKKSLSDNVKAIKSEINNAKNNFQPAIVATKLDDKAQDNLIRAEARFNRAPNTRNNIRFSAAQQIAAQTSSQKATALTEQKDAILDRQKALVLQQKINSSREREFRNTQRLNTIMPAVIAGLTLASSYLENIGEEGLKAFRESGNRSELDSARTGAVAGAGLGGAVTGGVGALLLNAALPAAAALSAPVLATGAAFAAITLGIYRATEAVEEFDKEVRLIEINKVTDSLTKALESVSTGRSSVFLQRNNVVGGVRDLRGRLATEADPGNREDINSAIDGSINSLQEFIDATVASSVSLDQFRNVIPDDTLEFFARRSGQSLEELTNGIRTTIESQANFNKRFEESILNLQAFEIRLRAEVALSSAIQQSVSGLNNLNETFNNVANGLVTTNTSSGLTDRLGSLGSIADIGKFESDLDRFTSSFGASLDGVTKDSVTAAQAIKLLPNILLDLRNSDPLGGSGEIVDNLRDTLSGLGIGGAIRDTIVNEIAGFGEGGKGDAGIVDAIGKDLTGILGNISDSLSSVGSSLEEATRKVNDELGIYAQGLESANQAILEADNRFASTFNIRRNLANTVSERPNFGAQQNLLNQEQNFATGGRGAGQVFADLVNSQKELVSLNEQLANTTDIQERKNLISLQREQALRIQKANQALDFLADASNRASVLESQLNKEREARQTRKGFAQRITFSTAEERAGINRNLGFARTAASAGTIDVVPEALRKEVQSLLSEIGDARIGGLGGRSGNEILDQLVSSSLRSAGVDPSGIITPSQEEAGITKEIERIFAESEKVQTQRAAIELQNANNFITNLDTSFSNFLSGLRDTILSGQRATVDQEIASIRGNLGQAAGLQRSGQQLQQLSGVDPETLRANFASIVDLYERSSKLTSELFKNIEKDQKDLTRSLREGVGLGRGSSSNNTLRQTAGTPESAEKIINNSLDFVAKRYTKEIADELKIAINEGGGRAKISSGSLLRGGAFSENLTVRTIADTLDGILNNSRAERERLNSEGLEIIGEVGGIDNLNKIIDNRASISQIIGQLPEKVEFSDLSKNIQNLETQLRIANQKREALGFNSGGYVPGSGSTDTVPAMLTPGEVVINKSAVQRIGAQNLLRLNSGSQVQKFNQGGIVQSIDQSSLGSFNASISSFMNGINTIAQALSNIPSKIEMTGNHRVEVVINGSQVLNNIMPEISALVKGEIKRSINRLITERFPEQGPFDLGSSTSSLLGRLTIGGGA